MIENGKAITHRSADVGECKVVITHTHGQGIHWLNVDMYFNLNGEENKNEHLTLTIDKDGGYSFKDWSQPFSNFNRIQIEGEDSITCSNQ